MAAFMKFWPIMQMVLSLLMLWICWSLRQLAIQEVTKIVNAAVAALKHEDEKLDVCVTGHEKRLTTVEKDVESLQADISQLPTKADLAVVTGELKVVGKAVEQVARGVGRIEDHFMEEGMKGAKS